MKRLYFAISFIVLGVTVAYFSPLAKMEASCIVGGYITRAIVTPKYCPGSPQGAVVLSAKYVAVVDRTLFYEVATCFTTTSGSCPIENEQKICSGFVDTKANEPFEIVCPLFVSTYPSWYVAVSLVADDIPIENYPTVMLSTVTNKLYLPLMTGGKK